MQIEFDAVHKIVTEAADLNDAPGSPASSVLNTHADRTIKPIEYVQKDDPWSGI